MLSLIFLVFIVCLIVLLLLLLVPASKAPPKAPKFRTQVVDVNGEKIYRSLEIKDKLREQWDERITTLYDLTQVRLKEAPDSPLFGSREFTTEYTDKYHYKTTSEFCTDLTHLGGGLANLGVSTHKNLGIWAQNCYEWVVTEHACYAYTITPVPLYHTFGIDSLIYIINHANLEVLVSTVDNCKKLFPNLERCPDLKDFIVIEDQTKSESERQKEMKELSQLVENTEGIHIYTFQSVMEEGKNSPVEHRPPSPSDLCGIVYTSGSTSFPKGVMVPHKMMISCMSAVDRFGYDYSEKDVYISYLPLPHIYERVVLNCLVGCGGRAAFLTNIRNILVELPMIRPTVLPAVPRVLIRVHDGLKKKLNDGPFIMRWAFNVAYYFKKRAILKGKDHPFLDFLIFNKIKSRISDKLNIVVSGGAPLPYLYQEFFSVVFCKKTHQGYGLTESCGPALLHHYFDYDDTTIGHTGSPFASCEVKLQSVPELGYSIEDEEPKGEILLRGNSIFKGYYKDEEKNKEVFTEDGWFKTGDICKVRKDGNFQIIDRKKNIIKLSQGEYVAVELLGDLYQQSKLIEQIFVEGDSAKNYLVAIVKPLFSNVKDKLSLNHLTENEMVSNKMVKQLILSEINRIGRANNKHGFEIPKSVLLIKDGFTIENGMSTATLKLKRPIIRKTFEKKIIQLYEQTDTEFRKNK
ncbi:long-chain-fatty-acid--coa ligase 5 [Anaeramoeba flamelloides]|uniref:Long-chain-fatty-acid--coa ligase 5 n=1 Tax=Anaeramoeba flamelloides TaxID=1746091 RepID=A0ABQ8ZDA4_9EUKA|nr:long-chain-fatty-acid--coa ligase 5 [Anaeramoeba flamelloides]